MAKLGDYSYPNDLDPTEAEDVLAVLVNEFGGEATNRSAFAQAIGHKSTNSGSFIRKVGDARKYGLLTPRGDYEATELGFRLANPTDETDRREVLHEMLQNIEVLSDIYDELNGNEPPGDFWRVLTETADVNPKEAREAAERIDYLYRRMLKFEVKGKPEASEDAEEGADESDSDDPSDTDRGIERDAEAAIYVRVDDDELRFSEIDDTRLDLAIQYLESMKSSEESGSQSSLEESV